MLPDFHWFEELFQQEPAWCYGLEFTQHNPHSMVVYNLYSMTTWIWLGLEFRLLAVQHRTPAFA